MQGTQALIKKLLTLTDLKGKRSRKASVVGPENGYVALFMGSKHVIDTIFYPLPLTIRQSPEASRIWQRYHRIGGKSGNELSADLHAGRTPSAPAATGGGCYGLVLRNMGMAVIGYRTPFNAH